MEEGCWAYGICGQCESEVAGSKANGADEDKCDDGWRRYQDRGGMEWWEW